MIEIGLLGSTKVEVDGVEIPEAALGGRLRQVLEILALNAGIWRWICLTSSVFALAGPVISTAPASATASATS